MAEEKHLKAWNLPWLTALIAIDIGVLYFLFNPEKLGTTSVAQLTAARMALTAGIPVLVLLLASLLPQKLKAMLVFWRWKDVLPGHRAFTKYGPTDSRVDMAALRKNVGVLPTIARDQNALWYRLYRAVATEHNVIDSHKSFLLFRDMAAVSILLAILVPTTMYILEVPSKIVWISLSLFLLQYIVTALAARNCGVRFLMTVLAEHSARRVVTARKGKP